tara:strand:- start:53 stop:331 length:279 start_codon:yes stop_codon:yes gene_type:complete
MGVLLSKVFTYELTNGSLVIAEEMGVRQISVFNSTATAGSITGSAKLGGTASSALAIAENETVTMQSVDASVINGVTITSPDINCTLKIIAQ